MDELGARLQEGLSALRRELESEIRKVIVHGGTSLVAPLRTQLAAPLRRVGAYLSELGEYREEDSFRFHIAVVGRFSTGKSTLLSAMAGSALAVDGIEGGLLPESHLPCTAIPTYLMHGSTDFAIYLVEHPKDKGGGGLRQQISTEQLKAMHFHPQALDGGDPFPDVARIEIEGALPTTLENAVLIDTLGDDHKAESTARTLQVVEGADAVVAVLRADMSGVAAADELRFLAKAAPHRAYGAKKMFFLINQYSPQQYDEDDVAYLWDLILAEQGRAQPHDGQKLADGDIHVVDALSAKRGRLESNADLLIKSGLIAFEERLAEFLLKDGLTAKIRPAIGDLIVAVGEIEAGVRRDVHRMRNRRINAETTAQSVVQPLSNVIEALATLKIETERTAGSIGGQIRQSFEAAMMSTVTQVGDALESYEIDSIKGFGRKVRHLVWKKPAVEEVQSVLQETVQTRMAEWASDSNAVTSPIRLFEGEQSALIEIIARRFADAEIELDRARRKLLGDETEAAAEDIKTRVAVWRARLQSTLKETVESQIKGVDFTGDYFQAAFGAAVMIGLAKVGLIPIAQATLVKIGVAMGINVVVGAASVIALPITAAAAVLGALFMNRDAAGKMKRKALEQFSKKMEHTTQTAWNAFYQDIAGTINATREIFDRQIEQVAEGTSAALRGLLNEANADLDQLQTLIEARQRDAAAIAATLNRLERLMQDNEIADAA